MRLKKIIAVFLFTLLVCTGCSTKDNQVQNTPNIEAIEYSSIEELPSYDEYLKFEDSKKTQIRLGIENLSVEEAEKYYIEYISDFLQDKEGAKLLNFEMKQDNLSLIHGKNNKSPLNIKVFMDIEMDAENTPEGHKKSKELCLNIVEHMRKSLFYSMKIVTENIKFYNTNKEQLTQLESDRESENGILFVQQDEIEYSAQTSAYNFGKKHFTLNKFGILDDTKELYVEYEIGDGFFGKSSDSIKKNTKKLNDISEEVKNYLLKEEAIKNCIEKNNLKILTISFYNTLLENKYLTFNFEV